MVLVFRLNLNGLCLAESAVLTGLGICAPATRAADNLIESRLFSILLINKFRYNYFTLKKQVYFFPERYVLSESSAGTNMQKQKFVIKMIQVKLLVSMTEIGSN